MHPVLKLIKQRKRVNSIPQKRNDPFKLGLAIEGGGMRGVVSAGMVTALEYFDLLNVFDEIYGNSAGAINGAYFLSEQAAYGTTIYYENINNKNFIDLRRLFSKKPIMSLDYLIHYVMKKEKILDWKAIINSPIRLNILMSSVSEAKQVRKSNFKDSDDLFLSLQASANMPIIAGAPISIDNDEYFDGGLFESIPYETALKYGCSHVLGLLTRPPQRYHSKPSFLDKTIGAKFLAKYNPRLKSALLERPQRYSNCINYLVSKSENVDGKSNILAIRVSEGNKPVSRLEKKRDALLAGAISGFKAVSQAFSGKDPFLYEIICPFENNGHKMKIEW